MGTPKYNLELLTPAQRELEEIALIHLELVGVKSARKITDRIYSALERLQIHPLLGILYSDNRLRLEGYRILICGHYMCIYRLLGDTVWVYHIADGRTNYSQFLIDLSKHTE